MAVASYTDEALPVEVRKELPDAARLTAALKWIPCPSTILLRLLFVGYFGL